MRFSLTRHHYDDGVLTLALVGEADMCAVDELGSAIQDTLGTRHCTGVVVDLTRVTFLDCAGIGALVAGRTNAVGHGCGYTVVNPQRQVRQVLELTGVLTALTGLPTRRWRPAEKRGHNDPGATVTTRELRRDRRAPSIDGVVASQATGVVALTVPVTVRPAIGHRRR